MSERGYFLEELAVGMRARLERTINEHDLYTFAGLCGDTNPLHFSDAFAENTVFKGRIVHGMLYESYLSAVLGTRLPGPGAVFVKKSVEYRKPVRIGETVIASVEVESIDLERGRATFRLLCTVELAIVTTGTADLLVPRRDEQAAP